MTLLRHLVAAAALTLTTIPLHANLFVVGEDKAPTQIALPSLGVPNLHRTFSIDVTVNNVVTKTLAGTIDEYVLVNSSSFNIPTVCPSCLDFAFLVSVTTAFNTGLESFGFGNVNGLTTDLDFAAEQNGINPTTANSLLFGTFDAVGWRNTTTHVGAGQNFDLLVVGTNATATVNNATVSLNKDLTDFSNAAPNGLFGDFIGPVLPTPEPSSVLLLSSAVFGIAAAFRRKLG